MSKIKVLHVTSSLNKNGTETFLMNLYRKIDREKFDFDFLVFTDSTTGYYEEVESLGARIYRLPARRDSFVRYLSNLQSFFKSDVFKEYSVVHYSGCNISSILPLYFAKKYGCDHILVHSHSSANISGLHNHILHNINRQFIPRLCNEYLACSNAAAKWFYRNLHLGKEVKILNNGIDLSTFFYDNELRNKKRKHLGLSNKLVISNISRFEEVKNHSFILDVFYELKNKATDAILLLVGDGSLVSEIKDKAKSLGIFDQCLFLGSRDDINDILNISDAILFPSFFEGVPLSLIEAQACGLPIFASTNVSSEVDITGLVQFLSLTEHPYNWADTILNSLKIHKRYDRGLDLTSNGYNLNKTVKLIENIYSKQN